jgi:hypothetical protein
MSLPWYSAPIPQIQTPVSVYEFRNKDLEKLVYASAVHEWSFAGSTTEQKDTFELLTWVGGSVCRSVTTVLLASLFPTSKRDVLNV